MKFYNGPISTFTEEDIKKAIEESKRDREYMNKILEKMTILTSEDLRIVIK